MPPETRKEPRGWTLRFETSIGIDAARTAQAGHDCLDYSAWVERDGRPLPRAKGPPRHDTWSCDSGYGLGWRDLHLSLYLRLPDDAIISLSIFQNDPNPEDAAGYRVVIARRDRDGNCLWRTTRPFNLDRIELTGG